MLRCRSFSLTEKTFKKSCERCSMPMGRCVSLFGESPKRPLFRRASVWNESSSIKLKSPFAGHSKDSNAWLLLLASWGNNEKAKTEKFVDFLDINRLTPRRKGPGIIIEEEDYYDFGDDIKRNIGKFLLSFLNKNLDAKTVTFSNVELVNENELNDFKNSLSFSIRDPDWNAPIQDITGLQIVRRSHLESGSSLSIIDSPLK